MNNPLFISYPGVVCAAGAGRNALWNAVTSGKQDCMKKVSAAGKEFFAARIDEGMLEAGADMKIVRIEKPAGQRCHHTRGV